MEANNADVTQALVVRVLGAKNLRPEGKKPSKVAVSIKLGEIVKRTSFVEPISGSGKALWDSQFVFQATDCQKSSVLEVSINRSSAAFFLKRSPGSSPSTLVDYSGFANVGTIHQSGWFPVGEEYIKLSLSWHTSQPTTPAENSVSSPGKPRLGFLSNSKFANVTDVRDPRVLHYADIIYGSDDEPAEGATAARTTLDLRISAGRNLRAVNFGGKSDPFVIVSVHGARVKGKILKNTLDPVWSLDDNVFRFGDVEDLDEDDEVRIVVKDWDVLGRYKDLGQVVLTISEIRQLSEREQGFRDEWLRLAPTLYMPGKTIGTDLGSIQITAVISRKAPRTEVMPIKTLLPDSPGIGSRSLASSKAVQSPVGLGRSGNLQHRASSSLPSSDNTTVEKPKLYVRVIQARNLFASDFGGVSDPYAVISCGSETRRTLTRAKTLTPVYDYETVFGEREYLHDNMMLKITFFDQDSVISTIVDDELGSVSIPLWSLLSTDEVETALTGPKWFSLEPANSKQLCAGEVQLALFYSNPALKKPDIYKGKVWLFELQATVHTARNLATMSQDPLARIKPYCTVSCGNKDKWRTTIASNGVNPTWAERFRFRQSADRGAERDGIQRTDSLKVTVFNSASGESLGKVNLDVAYIMDRLGYVDPQGKAFTSWFDLEPLSSQEEQLDVVDVNEDNADDEDISMGAVTIDENSSVGSRSGIMGALVSSKVFGPAGRDQVSSVSDQFSICRSCFNPSWFAWVDYWP